MCFKWLEKFIKRHELLSRKTRQLAVGVIFAYLVVVVILGLPAIRGCWDVITMPKTRSFELPLHINLNGTRSFDIDVSFVLKITYHKGALVVDEPIEFWGKALLVGNNTESIDHMQLGFQNGLLFNSTAGEIVKHQWGIPLQAYLFFEKNDSGIDVDENTGKIVSYMLEKTSLIWSAEGKYKPILGLVYQNETKPTLMIIEAIVLTVSSRDQLTQIQTNEVNTYLSLTVFIFSVFSVISIVIDLWGEGYKSTSNKSEKGTPVPQKQKSPKPKKGLQKSGKS